MHATNPQAMFEQACKLDAQGLEAEAIPFYRQALEAGLAEPDAYRAGIGLGSSLRNVGRPLDALEILEPVARQDTAALLFQALVLYDLGRHRELCLMLMERLFRLGLEHRDEQVGLYQRALGGYLNELKRNPDRAPTE
jgi:cyanophycin synthetase